MYVVSSKYIRTTKYYNIYTFKLRCEFPTIHHEYTIV